MRLTVLALLCGLFFLPACTGDDDEPPESPSAPVSTTAAISAPTPQAVVSAADLPRLQWELLPGPPPPPLEYTGGEPYVLDVETGRFYLLRDQAAPATRVPGDETAVQRTVSVLGWSDRHGFLVSVQAYHGPTGRAIAALVAGMPDGAIRTVLGPSLDVYVAAVVVHEAFVAVTMQSMQQGGRTETVILDAVSLSERQRIADRRVVSASGDGRFLALEDIEQEHRFLMRLEGASFEPVAAPFLNRASNVAWSHSGRRLV